MAAALLVQKPCKYCNWSGSVIVNEVNAYNLDKWFSIPSPETQLVIEDFICYKAKEIYLY